MMQYPQYLSTVKEGVEESLKAHFHNKVAYLSTFQTAASPLGEELSRFTLSGGKRMRAYLGGLGYYAFQQESPSQDYTKLPESLRALLMALEIFQSFCLIHDDIMDDDDVRRDAPTVHVSQSVREKTSRENARQFGLSMAILVGDMAMVWSDELIQNAVSAANWLTQEHRAKLLALYIQMKETVIIGQVLDVQATQLHIPIEQSVIDTLKTAWYSVIHPMQLGAALSGAAEKDWKQLEAIGLPIGLAFQGRDDVLDGVISESEFRSKVMKWQKQFDQALSESTVSPFVRGALGEVMTFVIERTS